MLPLKIPFFLQTLASSMRTARRRLR
jgi:hypothetical protein